MAIHDDSNRFDEMLRVLRERGTVLTLRTCRAWNLVELDAYHMPSGTTIPILFAPLTN